MIKLLNLLNIFDFNVLWTYHIKCYWDMCSIEICKKCNRFKRVKSLK